LVIIARFGHNRRLAEVGPIARREWTNNQQVINRFSPVSSDSQMAMELEETSSARLLPTATEIT
jgi:hypothetical protein